MADINNEDEKKEPTESIDPSVTAEVHDLNDVTIEKQESNEIAEEEEPEAIPNEPGNATVDSDESGEDPPAEESNEIAEEEEPEAIPDEPVDATVDSDESGEDPSTEESDEIAEEEEPEAIPDEPEDATVDTDESGEDPPTEESDEIAEEEESEAIPDEPEDATVDTDDSGENPSAEESNEIAEEEEPEAIPDEPEDATVDSDESGEDPSTEESDEIAEEEEPEAISDEPEDAVVDTDESREDPFTEESDEIAEEEEPEAIPDEPEDATVDADESEEDPSSEVLQEDEQEGSTPEEKMGRGEDTAKTFSNDSVPDKNAENGVYKAAKPESTTAQSPSISNSKFQTAALLLGLLALVGAAAAGLYSQVLKAELDGLRQQLETTGQVPVTAPVENTSLELDQLNKRIQELSARLEESVHAIKFTGEDWDSIKARIDKIEQSINSLRMRAAPPQTATILAPKQVKTQSPPAARKGDWAVNLESHSKENNADKSLKGLRSMGLPVEKFSVNNNGMTWYRLRVTGFSSAKEAKRYIRTTATQAGFPYAWTGQIQ